MNSKLLFYHFVNVQTGGANKYLWKTLEHNGVLFPPEYEKHDVPIIYDGKEIILDKDAEEAATLFARYYEHENFKNKTFRKNFWRDWKKILGKNNIIKNLDLVDFKPIYEHLLLEKEKKKLDTSKRELQQQEEEKYKYAIVDSNIQTVGNFRIEPPGIFMGRGCNPNLGKIKPRIYPEDIVINIGRESKIPEPIPGHKWKRVIHDRTVEWLAGWKDIITGKMKYVRLAANSEFKSRNDAEKFDLARKLKTKIDKIRKVNKKNLISSDIKLRQIATSLYFIDNFALRVGNEKSSDTADTVGVSSLRVEHVKLLDDNKIKLDFLGKDSVRYNKVLSVIPEVYENISEFIRDKDKNSDLFDKINSSDINKYLKTFMKGLTAKVFRTYNASNLFQEELKKLDMTINNYTDDDKINYLLDGYNRANARVATLCNHQKNITKSSNTQIEKLNTMIKEINKKLLIENSNEKKNKKKIDRLKKQLKRLKAKKKIKIELKNISLGTSKINYIDPRISIAFIKRYNIPISKVFTKTLQEKFLWANDIDENFVF